MGGPRPLNLHVGCFAATLAPTLANANEKPFLSEKLTETCEPGFSNQHISEVHENASDPAMTII